MGAVCWFPRVFSMQVLRSLSSVRANAPSVVASQIRCNSKMAPVTPDFSAPVFRRQAETETLSNGLRVSTYPVESTNAASVCLHVRTGSRFESEENNGANFVIDKLAFAGKSSSGNKSLAEAVEEIGGDVHLDRSREHVSYTINVEASQLGAATKLLGQAVSNLAKITPDQVENVRYRALGEKAALENDKQYRAMDHLHSIVYQQGSLGLPVQGNTTNLQKMNAQTLTNLVHQFYTADNMALSVAGRVGNDFVRTAADSFGNLGTSREAFSSEGSKYFGSFVTERDDTTDNVLVTIGYDGVSLVDEDAIVLQLVREMVGDYSKWTGVGNNSSSRLAEVTGTEGLADSFTTFNQSYSDAGLFGVSMNSQGKHLDSLVCEVCSEFVRLAHNARPAEVNRGKIALKNKILLAHDGVDRIARKIAQETLIDGYSHAIKSKLDQIDAITVDRVREVCTRKFTDTEPGVVGIGSTRKVPDYNQVRGWTHWWRI